MIIIEILDSIDSRILTEHAETIAPLLTCKKEYWRQGTFGSRKRSEYDKTFFNTKRRDYCYFWTGFIPKIQEYLFENHIPCTIINKIVNPMEFEDPILPITLRKDQLALLTNIKDSCRGIVLSPTGSGKTEIQMGLISSLPEDTKILFLSYSTSINKQTADKIIKYGLGKVQLIGGNNKFDNFYGNIVVSTIQSITKIDPKEYIEYFDAVIIDEAHHIRANGTQYIKVLSHLDCPIRVGFTATLPTDKESLLTMEGLVGPVIGELSRNDAIEKGIIAMPKVRLIKLPYNHDIKEKRTYFDVYQRGIVENNTRNRLICQTAKQYINEGLTVIILINRIEHGEELKRLCDVVFRINAKFIYGETEQDERETVKQDFINGDIDCVIASSAWGEGINIPTVNVMINAAGGKDELRVLQHIGRVLRKTESKDSALVIDFFDPSHHYLINHFGSRVTLYMDEGWL